ncbi:hypothetical protein [Bradyrhizobium guangdongense]
MHSAHVKTFIKLIFGLICLAILASHVMTMLRWSEARGVYDDVCYLRQAHLFQRFGLNGFDTDAAGDDDRYFVGKLKQIAFPEPNNLERWPCHIHKSGGKLILQYPPGTGFLLALFPEGFQVAPLYIASSIIVCGFALLGVLMAPTLFSGMGAGLFGALAVYLMINPAKASYSIAPTVALCAVVGFLTARWLTEAKRSILLIALIGLLIGVSVNLRLPNLLLAAGYCLFLATAFMHSRTLATFLHGLAFGAGALVGMAPTLIAQAVNAGSPFATTYGANDARPPAIDVAVLGEYLRDTQLFLIGVAVVWTGLSLRVSDRAARQSALIVAGNLVVNLGFFMSHPIFTQYYVVPIAMLSMWTLSFAWLMPWRELPEIVSIQGKALAR